MWHCSQSLTDYANCLPPYKTTSTSRLNHLTACKLWQPHLQVSEGCLSLQTRWEKFSRGWTFVMWPVQTALHKMCALPDHTAVASAVGDFKDVSEDIMKIYTGQGWCPDMVHTVAMTPVFLNVCWTKEIKVDFRSKSSNPNCFLRSVEEQRRPCARHRQLL